MEQFMVGNTWFLAQFKANYHKIAERNLRRQNSKTFYLYIRKPNDNPSSL